MYYVLDQKGDKFGPADLNTVRTWYSEGFILPFSIVEDARTGQQTRLWNHTIFLEAPVPGQPVAPFVIAKDAPLVPMAPVAPPAIQPEPATPTASLEAEQSYSIPTTTAVAPPTYTENSTPRTAEAPDHRRESTAMAPIVRESFGFDVNEGPVVDLDALGQVKPIPEAEPTKIQHLAEPRPMLWETKPAAPATEQVSAQAAPPAVTPEVASAPPVVTPPAIAQPTYVAPPVVAPTMESAVSSAPKLPGNGAYPADVPTIPEEAFLDSKTSASYDEADFSPEDVGQNEVKAAKKLGKLGVLLGLFGFIFPIVCYFLAKKKLKAALAKGFPGIKKARHQQFNLLMYGILLNFACFVLYLAVK